MKRESLVEFEAEVARAVQPIVASGARKRVMREELLAHLLEAYEEELARTGNEEAAKSAALRRFGNGDELVRDLQGSVSGVERGVCNYFTSKETVMNRVLWILGIGGLVVSESVSFPYRQAVIFAVITFIAILIFAHLLRAENLASRYLGNGWRFYVGTVAALFGSSMILPVCAQLKHGKPWWFVLPAVLGVLIMIGGAGFVLQGIRNWRARIA